MQLIVLIIIIIKHLNNSCDFNVMINLGMSNIFCFNGIIFLTVFRYAKIVMFEVHFQTH